MALRGSEHATSMLDWAEPTGRAMELVLAMPRLGFKKKKRTPGQEIITGTQ